MTELRKLYVSCIVYSYRVHHEFLEVFFISKYYGSIGEGLPLYRDREVSIVSQHRNVTAIQ